MKTIGILAFTDPSMGGVWQYTKSMIDALALDKKNKYVIFCEHDHEEFRNAGLEIRVVPTIRHRTAPNIFLVLLRLLSILVGQPKAFFFSQDEKNLFKDVDLFFCPENFFYPHLFLHKPYVYTLHDFQERYYPQFFSLKKRITRYFVKRTCAKFAAHILCESAFVKNDIMKFTGVTDDKISIIPSPPPRELLETVSEGESERVRMKYQLPSQYLFYPAQFWPHKNHVTLLEAFNLIQEKYPSLQLILVGSKQNNQNTVIEKIQSLGLESRVKILGYVEYSELRPLYSMSSMLVMPTLFESVSIPVYEAFAQGAPVCSSNVVALLEQVGEAGLLFDPMNAKDIADKIQTILDNPTLAQTLVDRGHEKMRAFTSLSYAASLSSILKRLESSLEKEKTLKKVIRV